MQKLIHVLVVESYGMLISMGFLNDCEVFFAGVFSKPIPAKYDNYFFNRTKRRETLAKECRQITTFIVNDNKSSKNSRVSPHRDGLKSA